MAIISSTQIHTVLCIQPHSYSVINYYTVIKFIVDTEFYVPFAYGNSI